MLQLTESGLRIQTLTEIKSELEAALRAAFGDNVNLTPQSVFGQLVGILAEREAITQDRLMDLYRAWNPNTASGVSLDIVAALTGSNRLPATASTAVGIATGDVGTEIANGRIVKLLETETSWDVIAGTRTLSTGELGYVIDSDTGIPIKIQAQETGPIQALATVSEGWEITTTVSGWDAFATEQDAQPGRSLETDAEFRVRRLREIFSVGNASLPAITSNVSQVEQVELVRVYENTGLTKDLTTGIPGKAINVLVDAPNEDQVNEAIAREIFNSKPAGIQTFGWPDEEFDPDEPAFVKEIVIDGEGNHHLIQFNRVVNVPINIEAIVTTGSEEDYPTNGDDLVESALLEYGNATARIGADVVPYKFIAAIEIAGVLGISNVQIQLARGDSSVGPGLVEIGIRERPSYDSERIEVIS